MQFLRPWASLLGKFLLGVLISSTAWAVTPQRLKSVDHFEEIIKTAGFGSNSVIVVFEPDDFAPEEAQQIEDALELARAWNGWLCKDGTVISQLKDKMNLVRTASPMRPVDARVRADLMFEWFWSRIEAAPFMPAEVLKDLEARIPSHLNPIKGAISFVFEAKRSGNMRNYYANNRARLHAFRQQNLGLRVISCEAAVAGS